METVSSLRTFHLHPRVCINGDCYFLRTFHLHSRHCNNGDVTSTYIQDYATDETVTSLRTFHLHPRVCNNGDCYFSEDFPPPYKTLQQWRLLLLRGLSTSILDSAIMHTISSMRTFNLHPRLCSNGYFYFPEEFPPQS